MTVSFSSRSSRFLEYIYILYVLTRFRHEIAFVFGQLSTSHAIPALLDVLRNETESPMVRHEAAEALGGIVGEGELGSWRCSPFF